MEGPEQAVLALVLTIISGATLIWLTKNKELCDKLEGWFDRAFPYLIGGMLLCMAGMVLFTFWVLIIKATTG